MFSAFHIKFIPVLIVSNENDIQTESFTIIRSSEVF